MTVAELMNRISAREFAEWKAYLQIEPFGEDRDDIRSAIIACVIANCNREKGKPPFKISDFVPKFKNGQPMDDEEMKLELMKLMR